MKNKNKIKGKGSTNTIVQTERGDIRIDKIVNQSNELISVPTEKVKTIKTGLTSSVATLIAVIALLIDFSALILNFGQFLNVNSIIRNGLLIFFMSVAIFSFFVIIITIELRRKGFSSLLPGTPFTSEYIFTLGTENRIWVQKLKMTCPKCYSQMTIGSRPNGYYFICKRNSDHSLKFDYTTLDHLD